MPEFVDGPAYTPPGGIEGPVEGAVGPSKEFEGAFGPGDGFDGPIGPGGDFDGPVNTPLEGQEGAREGSAAGAVGPSRDPEGAFGPEGDLEGAMNTPLEGQEGPIKIAEETIVETVDSLISKLQPFTSTVRFIDIPPDLTVQYEQGYEPKCKVCNHELRDDAEYIYVNSRFSIEPVLRWFDDLRSKTGAEPGTEEYQALYFHRAQLTTHFNKHCSFDDPTVNQLVRLESREKDLQKIASDRIGWGLNSITSALMDLHTLDTSRSITDATKLFNALCAGHKTIVELMKFQMDNAGPLAQARDEVQANNERVIALLSRIMATANADQQTEILNILKSFQGTQERNGGK
jgi:hypothetical protein